MSVTQGEKTVTLAGPGGATAEVAYLGATVISYQTDGKERLFKSTKSSIDGPKPIRGGIPICWPIFGPPPEGEKDYSKLKQHGIARSSKWDFAGSTSDPTQTSATFVLNDSEHSRQEFDFPFKLEYIVQIDAAGLNLNLNVTAKETPLKFQALLHAYVALPEDVLPPQVGVKGFKDVKFFDKVSGVAENTETRETITIDGPDGEIDRGYLGAPSSLEIVFPGSSVQVTKTLPDAVVWNPGPAKAAALADMQEKGNERFFCLEPGLTRSWVKIDAGKTWSGGATYKWD